MTENTTFGSHARIATFVAVGLFLSMAACDRPARRTAGVDTAKKTSTAGSGVVVVPGVIGVERGQALAALERQGLRGVVLSERDDCSKPVDTILSQDPPARIQVEPGTEVRLITSKRSPVVPDSTGEPEIDLAAGDAHTLEGRHGGDFRFAFALSGDVCSRGAITVAPREGPAQHYLLAAGQIQRIRLEGTTTVTFISDDPDARLLLTRD